MRTPRLLNPRSTRSALAFSLVELMVGMSLLSLITIGLLVMFNQTQKTLRATTTQTDLLESGRSTIALMTRELQEIGAAGRLDAPNLEAVWNNNYGPLIQTRPGASESHTNYLQRLFFVHRSNNKWSAVGYFVAVPRDKDSASKKEARYTLFRFQAVTNRAEYIPALYRQFTAAIGNYEAAGEIYNIGNVNGPPLHRVAQGVLNLRLKAFDTRGMPVGRVDWSPENPTLFARLPATFSYLSNSLPASIELEIGILESQALERYRTFESIDQGNRFLRNQAGKLHLFRQRIPLRTAS